MLWILTTRSKDGRTLASLEPVASRGVSAPCGFRQFSTACRSDSYLLSTCASYAVCPACYREAGHRVTGPRHYLGLDFRRGSATLGRERPRVVPRGFCFDPVRR